MARAYGASAALLLKRETAYGTEATGDYVRMPFNRCSLGSEQGLIDDPVLGQGHDPLAPLRDAIVDEGDIVVPVDMRYLGVWLTGLLGDPVTADNLDGTFDHVFASGAQDIPSYSIEVGQPEVPAFFMHTGVKLNSIALEFQRSGSAAATIGAVAQGETRYGASQGGTPTSLAFSRISQFQGSITRGGAPVGNLTGGSLIKKLARRHIFSWDGVESDDGPAEPTPENVAAILEIYPVGERFFQEFTLRQVLLNAAKNGSGPSAAGTSAEGPTTAKGAATKETPAPKAKARPNAAPTGSTRPARKRSTRSFCW